jgi:hypothetical protein
VDNRGYSGKTAEVEVIHAANALTDAISRLKASEKFRGWKPSYAVRTTPAHIEKSNLLKDKHYTPDELAELWGVSVDSIRRIFRDEPGVLKMGEKSPKHKRQYLTLRIPESVVERVYTRLSE